MNVMFDKEAKWPHHQLAGMKATLDEHPVLPQSHSLHFSEVEQARNKGPQLRIQKDLQVARGEHVARTLQSLQFAKILGSWRSPSHRASHHRTSHGATASCRWRMGYLGYWAVKPNKIIDSADTKLQLKGGHFEISMNVCCGNSRPVNQPALSPNWNYTHKQRCASILPA